LRISPRHTLPPAIDREQDMTGSTLALTLTIDQAAALSRQLDLAMRIHLIQFRELEHIARMGELKHRSGRALTMDECSQLDVWLKLASGIFGFESNSSFGIGSPHVSDDAHRGYEIMKVVQKALATHRDPNPTGIRGVNYDGLCVRYTKDPAPVAAISGDNDGGAR
jgi:hypothetical protein